MLLRNTLPKEGIDMDYTALGKEIRELRRKRNLTQEKLAELADLSVPYISHLERGTKKPSLAVLVRLADV